MDAADFNKRRKYALFCHIGTAVRSPEILLLESRVGSDRESDALLAPTQVFEAAATLYLVLRLKTNNTGHVCTYSSRPVTKNP